MQLGSFFLVSSWFVFHTSTHCWLRWTKGRAQQDVNDSLPRQIKIEQSERCRPGTLKAQPTWDSTGYFLYTEGLYYKYSVIGITISQYEDLYEPISIMECQKGFRPCSHGLCLANVPFEAAQAAAIGFTFSSDLDYGLAAEAWYMWVAR